jgi:hypothetical protein
LLPFHSGRSRPVTALFATVGGASLISGAFATLLGVSTGWLSKLACFARATSGDSFRGREIRTQIRTCYCEQVSTEAVRLLGPIDLGRTNRKRILSDSTMPDETSEPKPTEKKRERTVRDLKPKIDPKGGASNAGKSGKATRRTEEVDFDWTLRS